MMTGPRSSVDEDVGGAQGAVGETGGVEGGDLLPHGPQEGVVDGSVGQLVEALTDDVGRGQHHRAVGDGHDAAQRRTGDPGALGEQQHERLVLDRRRE